MIRGVFVFFLLLFIGFYSGEKYVNTHELVLVPGHVQPLTLLVFDHLEKYTAKIESNYLSEFIAPGNGGNVLSGFGPRSGRMHYGTDIKMNRGDTVIAANEGYVERATYAHGFGNLIVIRHKNNLQTYYAHLSGFLVKKGSWVEKGNPIGLAGRTGRARGNHLHFEIRENEVPFDPELLFDLNKMEVREEANRATSMAHLHRMLKPKRYATNVAVPEYYTVRPGESLWVISRRYKTSIEQICELNNISENSILKVGQPLRIY